MRWFYLWASPQAFFLRSKKYVTVIAVLFLLSFLSGLIGGLYLAPPDYQQGDAFRIIYVHVPAAILSLAVFTVMSICSLIFLIWRIKLADVCAEASALLGAAFTFLALITGMLWGKPMWGAFWVWDARLTSELILLFIYFAVIALRSALPESINAKAVAIFTLVGFVDIPIIHFSVNWWNTLHQGATVLKLSRPAIAPDMLYPLLIFIFSYFSFYSLLLLMRMRYLVLWRERKSEWVNIIFSKKR